MKGSRRSAPARTSSRRVLKISRPSLESATPSTDTKASARRIADKMQILALTRPNMLHLIEILVDGMLGERRRDDHARLDG